LESDGVIINTSEAYEATALQAYRSWLSEKSIEAFAFNFPPSPPLKKLPAEAQQIQDFLDAAELKHGKHSVVFVRCYFCSSMWIFFELNWVLLSHRFLSELYIGLLSLRRFGPSLTS